MIRRPPRSPLFPSTTLSRSVRPPSVSTARRRPPSAHSSEPGPRISRTAIFAQTLSARVQVRTNERRAARSEEHTSELQSHLNLVCRLLLEKKKKNRAERVQ